METPEITLRPDPKANNPDTRTMAQLAQEAIDIQNACNLSGLVFSMARSMKRFNELNPRIGTDERNRHPIWYLWIDKLGSLTGSQFEDSFTYSNKMFECEKIAKGET